MSDAREYPRPFGRYVLLRLLGAGGMGEVYAALARQTLGLERLCALKTIRPDLAREKEFRRRFRDEARISVSMSHPNVIGVHEVGCIDDTYFIAMELCEGYDLGRILSRARRHNLRFSVPAALFIARELLAALDYSHQHTDAYGAPMRLVHRDISPSNVMISFDGRVRLADFGLASSAIKAVRTAASRVWGRPGYVAPERLLGRKPDRRVDIYAVGVLLFELLTGEPLVRATEPATALREAQRRAKIKPSTMRREISTDLDAVIQRAVAFDPSERYGAAAAFQDDTQVCLARIDPVYNARRLAGEVMGRLFDETSWRKPLRDVLELASKLSREDQEPHVETFAGTNVLDSHTAGELGLGVAGVIDSPQLPLLDTPQLRRLDADPDPAARSADLHRQETLVFAASRDDPPTAPRLDSAMIRRIGNYEDDDADADDETHTRPATDHHRREPSGLRTLAAETFEVIHDDDALDGEIPREVIVSSSAVREEARFGGEGEPMGEAHAEEDGSAPDATIVDDFSGGLLVAPDAEALAAVGADAETDDTVTEQKGTKQDTASGDTASGQSAFDALLRDPSAS